MKLAWIVLSLAVAPTVAHASAPFHVENASSEALVWKSSSELDVREFDVRNPPTLVFDSWSEISKCSLDGSPCTQRTALSIQHAQPHVRVFNLQLVMKSGTTQAFKIELFEKLGDGFRIVGRSQLKKNILFGYDDLLMMLSPKGEVLYYFRTPFFVSDFKQHLVDGRIFYSYFHHQTGNLMLNVEGNRVVLDEHFKIVDTPDVIVDGHEFVILGPRHYLFSSYDGMTASNGKCKIDQNILEWKDGREVSRAHLNTFALAFGASPHLVQFHGHECEAVGHFNSIQVIDDDHWILETHARVFEYDRKTQQPTWILGGKLDQFKIGDAASARLWHCARWDDQKKELTVFDNGIHFPDTPAGVRVFKLDLASKSVLSRRFIPVAKGVSEYGGCAWKDGDSFSVTMGEHKTEYDFIETRDGSIDMAVRVWPRGAPYNYRVNLTIVP